MDKSKILIVDDIPANIDVLTEILHEEYELMAAVNGKRALDIAENNKPDLILLDVMMPEMDGFEVCRILKKSQSTKDIPVIFVTASNKEIDEKLGLELGAVDFLRKPVNPPIVKLRVKNQLTIYNHQKILEETVRLRTSELRKLNVELEQRIENAVSEIRSKDHIVIQKSREAAAGELLSLIAHHWRQPLNSVGLIIQSLSDAFEFEELTEKYMNEKVEEAMKNLQELSKTIDKFRYLYDDLSENTNFSLKKNIENLISLNFSRFRAHGIKLEFDCNDDVIVYGNPSDFSQAIYNIINNAFEIHTVRKNPEPYVFLRCQKNNDKVIISIKDNAGGIDEDIKDKIFDLYSSTKEGLNNTGIGLYLTSLIIEKNINGKIDVVDEETGTVFNVSISVSSFKQM